MVGFTFVTVTTSYGAVVVDDLGYPAPLDTGVRCGHCTARHNSAAAVRFCHDIARDQQRQQEDELAAERAVERHFEDRGYWEARAQDYHEAAMGVVPFHVAMADALAAA